jgi:hypothetical protein
MTDHQSQLERRYRRLLALYPRAFRQEHGDEMLVVLLACARDGRRGSALADTANLLGNAVWMRVRFLAPRSLPGVFWGARLMVVAAFGELVCMGVVIATQSSVRAAVLSSHIPGLTAARLANSVHASVVSVEYGAPIAAALWLLLAWANDRGHGWGRPGAVGLFGITAVSLLVSVSRHAAAYAPIDLIAGAVLCLIALVAMLLIITADSGPHYRPRGPGKRAPQAHPTVWRAGSDIASWN